MSWTLLTVITVTTGQFKQIEYGIFLASMLNLIALLPAYSKVFGFNIWLYGSIFASTSSTETRRYMDPQKSNG